jgi:hypothetical protein
MQYRYALAEGAMYRPIKWKEDAQDTKEFPTEVAMFHHAESQGWDLVTVLASGHSLNYRQWYFKHPE